MSQHRIAVLSDTHNHLPEKVLHQLQSADSIWHLGDVVRPSVLDPIRLLGKNFVLVRGNCDTEFDWPLTRSLVFGKTIFQLIHIPPDYFFANPDENKVLLHGHLHTPRDEIVNGVRVLSPGAISQPRAGSSPSFAWLDVEENGDFTWRLIETN
ncbi:MAG: metallophosphoesterase family protein [Chthoniobacterales bacterium]